MIDSFRDQYAFLSNSHVSPFKDRVGTVWPTVEHFYQAFKLNYLLPGAWGYDQCIDAFDRVLVPGFTANDAKRLARTFPLDVPRWDDAKVQVMRDALAYKFEPSSTLAVLLHRTGDEELVEGNTWNDRFWGVCRGVGENWLGKILMERREANRGRGYTLTDAVVVELDDEQAPGLVRSFMVWQLDTGTLPMRGFGYRDVFEACHRPAIEAFLGAVR